MTIFEQKQIASLYEMFLNFQKCYYYKDIPEPCIEPNKFSENVPRFVIDCSHQIDTLKGGSVDVRLEFETSKNISDKTSAYCLIIHDALVKYNKYIN